MKKEMLKTRLKDIRYGLSKLIYCEDGENYGSNKEYEKGNDRAIREGIEFVDRKLKQLDKITINEFEEQAKIFVGYLADGVRYSRKQESITTGTEKEYYTGETNGLIAVSHRINTILFFIEDGVTIW